jgi:hypothetical protein
MLVEVARPVRCGPARTTSRAKLQRSLEMPKFHAEARECREGVDDEPTAVADVVIMLFGVGPLLERTVDADRVRHSFVFPHVCASPISVPGGESQKAHPESVCCIRHPPRLWRPASHDGTRRAG